MSEKVNKEYPYKMLGNLLKRMREKKQESLDEVSGAVEIDSQLLTDFERGLKRPSEDILLLLISYFSVGEDVADKLWDLAGYDRSQLSSTESGLDDIQQVMVLPMDARIVYTDMAHIMSNKYGVTLNFMQSMGLGGKPLAVARLGMSREHAERLLELLQKALTPQEIKLLPAPKDSDTPKNKS